MWFKRHLGLPARCALAGMMLLTTLGALLGQSAGALPQECDGTAFLTWRSPDGGPHKLSTIDTDSGELTDVAPLPFRINAVGHATQRQKLFGLARASDGRQWRQNPHLVSVSTEDGRTQDLGPLRGNGSDSPGLAGAYAGTMLHDTLVVLTREQVLSIDVSDSGKVGTVTTLATLAEPAEQLAIGDIAADPATGLVYGLGTNGGLLITINPRTGGITRTAIAGLPGKSLFGAVFMTEERELFGAVNGIDGKARLFRVPLGDATVAGKLIAIEVARWPELTSADAAYCPRRTPVPDEPTPTLSSSVSPSISASPSVTAPSERPSPAAATTPRPEPSTSSTVPATPPSQEEPPDDTAAASIVEPPDDRPGAPTEGVMSADEAGEPAMPRRWIAVGIIVIAMAGAAGVKASGGRGKQ